MIKLNYYGKVKYLEIAPSCKSTKAAGEFLVKRNKVKLRVCRQCRLVYKASIINSLAIYFIVAKNLIYLKNTKIEKSLI